MSHPVGEGMAYYYGTAFTEQAAGVFLTKLGCASPMADVVSLPESCELAVRSNDSGEYLFLLNYLKEPAAITVKQPCVNMATGETVSGEITLPAYGVLVLKR